MSKQRSSPIIDFAKPVQRELNSTDRNTPLTFSAWLESNNSIVPSKEIELYTTYLTAWFSRTDTQEDFNVTNLRKQLIAFLVQIQHFFSKEEVINWYDNIDLTSERDILISIPFFAEKLKEISLYSQQKRVELQATKLKYNLVGTDFSITKELTNKVTDLFTKKPYQSSITIDKSLWGNFPDLSSLQSDLNIKLVELYDTTNYFDTKNDDLNVSANNNAYTTAVQYLSSRGLELAEALRMYKSSVSLAQSIDPQLNVDIQLYLADLINKIVSLDKQVISIDSGNSGIVVDTFNIPLLSGRSFFYWPSGAFTDSNSKQYYPYSLSASPFHTRGIASETLEGADTIFVKDYTGTKAAWLSLTPFATSVSTMKVECLRGDLLFKYPYPGYGLSAEDVTWTGRSLSSQKSFVFLTDEQKSSVERAYWSYTDAVTLSSRPLHINSSKLTTMLTPSLEYKTSDTIKTWDTLPTIGDSSLSGVPNEAWLFKFQDAIVPVRQSNDNLYLWPYTTILSADSLDTNIPIATRETCAPTSLSTVVYPGMIAGGTPQTADKIYKVSNFRMPSQSIIGAAWLSGVSVSSVDVEYIQQPGFSLKVDPNEYSIFVWTGPNIPISLVFGNKKHAQECAYYKNKLTYVDSVSCTCKQVYNTSFGHNGLSYDEHNRLADSIMLVDSLQPVINLRTWRGIEDNNDYKSSKNFAWYQTNNAFSWGDGRWSNDFTLSAGRCYCYYRANYGDQDSGDKIMPFLRKTYSFDKTYRTAKWVDLVIDDNGEWLSSVGVGTDIQLYPGNYIMYDRANSVTYNTISSYAVPQEILENISSAWSYDRISIGNSIPIVVSTPLPTDSAPITPEQTPAFDVTQLKTASWSLSYFDTLDLREVNTTLPTTVQLYNNTPVFSFTPMYTGLYCIEMSGVVLSSVPETVTIGTELSTGTADIDITTYTNSYTLTFSSITPSLTVRVSDINLFTTETVINSAQVSSTTGRVSSVSLTTLIFTHNPLIGGGMLSTVYNIPVPLWGNVNTLNVTGIDVTATPVEPQNQLEYNIVKSVDFNIEMVLQTGVYFTLLDQEVTIDVPIFQTIYNTQEVDVEMPFSFKEDSNTVYGIPAITAINPTALESVTLANTYTPCGFNFKVPLFGWNYTSRRYDGVSYGARPFWLKTPDRGNVLVGGERIKYDNENNIDYSFEFSDLTLQYEKILQINNNHDNIFTWTEDVYLLSSVNLVEWKKLAIDTGAQSVDIITSNSTRVSATNDISDIIFRTYTNAKQQEVYYYSQDPTSWTFDLTAIDSNAGSNSSISWTTEVSAFTPYKNLLSREVATIATYPVFTNLKESKERYFTPTSLGMPVFVGLDIQTEVKSLSHNSFVTLSGNLGGDDCLFEVTGEDSSWLKEPLASQAAAGNIHKNVYKEHQSFIPYKSTQEVLKSNNIGIASNTFRQSPWDDFRNAEKWSDNSFKFDNKIGLVDTNVWLESNIFKINGLLQYKLESDIYGNQYALYKNGDKFNIDSFGKLWVRKENGYIESSYTSLSGVFENKSTQVQSELYEKLQNISVHINTAVFETENYICFDQLQYNYNTSNIYNNSIDSVLVSKLNKKVSLLWFDIIQKELSYAVVDVNKHTISLLVYNLNTRKLNEHILHELVSVNTIKEVLLCKDLNTSRYILTIQYINNKLQDTLIVISVDNYNFNVNSLNVLQNIDTPNNIDDNIFVSLIYHINTKTNKFITINNLLKQEFLNNNIEIIIDRCSVPPDNIVYANNKLIVTLNEQNIIFINLKYRERDSGREYKYTTLTIIHQV